MKFKKPSKTMQSARINADINSIVKKYVVPEAPSNMEILRDTFRSVNESPIVDIPNWDYQQILNKKCEFDQNFRRNYDKFNRITGCRTSQEFLDWLNKNGVEGFVKVGLIKIKEQPKEVEVEQKVEEKKQQE